MADNNKATSLDNVKQYVKGVLQGWFSNKATLDKLSTATNGDLLYNGNPVGGGGDPVTIDAVLSSTSENPVQNKAVYSALEDKADVTDIPDVTGFATQSAVAAKQDILTFDGSPIENSTNPVTSGGIYAALQSFNYELPKASQNILGGIRVGAGLAIDEDGILYVVGATGQDGFLTLSETSVSLNSENKTATVSVLAKSAPVSVRSSNTSLASASINGDTIVITAGSGNGSCEIIVETRQTGIYSSTSKTITVNVMNVKIVSWAGGTDAEIKAMLDAHYSGDIDVHDYWKVGDKRNVALSAISSTSTEPSQPAQTISMILVNSGGKYIDDGIQECAFIVHTESCLSGNGTMHSSSSTSIPWSNCNCRTWLNNQFKNALPSVFRSCFKQFKNDCYSFEYSSYAYRNFDKKEDVTDLFSLASIGELASYQYSTINRWKYYEDGASVKKGKAYFTRDAYSSGATTYGFGAITASGNVSGAGYSVSYGFAPFGVI